MKKVSAIFHSGPGQTTNQAMGIASAIVSVEQVTAKVFGVRIATVTRDLQR